MRPAEPVCLLPFRLCACVQVLTGAISDANTPWLAKLLHSRGVDLVRVEVVPDDVRDICETVLR